MGILSHADNEGSKWMDFLVKNIRRWDPGPAAMAWENEIGPKSSRKGYLQNRGSQTAVQESRDETVHEAKPGGKLACQGGGSKSMGQRKQHHKTQHQTRKTREREDELFGFRKEEEKMSYTKTGPPEGMTPSEGGVSSAGTRGKAMFGDPGFSGPTKRLKGGGY